MCFQGRRVLLAEDNLINQKVAQMMLTSLGMRAEVANNGQEAVRLVHQAEQAGEQFHCVLMDMAMPVMGGVDATLVRFLFASLLTPQSSAMLLDDLGFRNRHTLRVHARVSRQFLSR